MIIFLLNNFLVYLEIECREIRERERACPCRTLCSGCYNIFLDAHACLRRRGILCTFEDGWGFNVFLWSDVDFHAKQQLVDAYQPASARCLLYWLCCHGYLSIAFLFDQQVNLISQLLTLWQLALLELWPPPMMGHSACIHKDSMVVFGGVHCSSFQNSSVACPSYGIERGMVGGCGDQEKGDALREP